jgi:hypothetical protein
MNFVADLCLLVVGLSGALPASENCSRSVPGCLRSQSMRRCLLMNFAAGLFLLAVGLNEVLPAYEDCSGPVPACCRS